MNAKQVKAELRSEAKRILSAGFTRIFTISDITYEDEGAVGFTLKYDNLSAEDRKAVQRILTANELGIEDVDVVGGRYDWRNVVDVVFGSKSNKELP